LRMLLIKVAYGPAYAGIRQVTMGVGWIGGNSSAVSN